MRFWTTALPNDLIELAMAGLVVAAAAAEESPGRLAGSEAGAGASGAGAEKEWDMSEEEGCWPWSNEPSRLA